MSKFTPQEQKCISAKIPILRDEGMSEDQAVAVAIAKCAPDKAKKKMACCPQCEEGNSCKCGSKMANGYSYQRLNSGLFRVFDVPIMAEVPEGMKENRKRIGPKWMKAAVKKAKLRWKQDGYKAPLHIEHHGGNSETSPAGFMMPHTVKQMRYEGNPVWAVFADLEVHPHILKKIQNRELPFRSVEVFSWEKPEINSMALLKSEVPFFSFDLLELGKEVSPVEKFSTVEPFQACRAFTNGNSILFSFKDNVSMRKKMESRAERADVDRYEYEEGKDEEKRDVEEELSAKLEEIVEKDKEEHEERVELDEDGRLGAVLDLLAKIAEKLGVDKEEEMEDVEEVEEAEIAVAPVEQKALAALSGKVAALEARERSRKSKEKQEKMVDVAMNELAAWNPDEETRNNLSALVSSSNRPHNTIKAFVASYKKSVPRFPHNTFSDFEASFDQADDPSVMRFAADGADALDMARNFSQQYDELEARGMITTNREDFIQIQMDASQTGTIVKR
ncbi:MAG: hypothetical protein CL793_07300 [Chloroflexi bacterium]|nr:hypothetical protein [Chloroflexota bacterium]